MIRIAKAVVHWGLSALLRAWHLRSARSGSESARLKSDYMGLTLRRKQASIEELTIRHARDVALLRRSLALQRCGCVLAGRMRGMQAGWVVGLREGHRSSMVQERLIEVHAQSIDEIAEQERWVRLVTMAR